MISCSLSIDADNHATRLVQLILNQKMHKIIITIRLVLKIYQYSLQNQAVEFDQIQSKYFNKGAEYDYRESIFFNNEQSSLIK